MRTILVLAFAGMAGAANAQVFFPGPIDPLTDHRLQLERDRMAADLRSLQAAQSRVETQLESQRLNSMLRTPPVALTPLPEPDTGLGLPAPLSSMPAPRVESRQRTDELRALEAERRLLRLRSGL